MQPSRFLGLLVLLLVAQGWCKPAKSAEGDIYSDDDPSDYNDEDTPTDDEDTLPDERDDAGAVEEPPEIISESKSIHVRLGDTIMLPCSVRNAENFAITWEKDKTYLYSDNLPYIEDSERIVRLPNNTLVIHNARVNDSSDHYKCSILIEPPITIVHRVRVNPTRAPTTLPPPPPHHHKSSIEVTPGSRVEVSAGESVTLGCNARMQPTPEIKWYRENEKISGNVTVEGNHITIRNVNRHDSGRYQCLVEDGSEKPAIGAITLIVNYAPEIEVKRKLVHTGLGVESELTCIVEAHPHATVSWYKNQEPVVHEKGRIAIKANRTKHTLEILHTDLPDFGEYSCEAVNTMGQDLKIISLTGAPSQAIIYGGEMMRTANGLILKWRLESFSPITEYKLQYRRRGEEQWNVVKPTVVNGKGNQFTVAHSIEGLQPGSYEAILTARNDFGWSQPSVPHMFTGEYEMKEAENVKGSAATSRPWAVSLALFLVVSSCAFTSL